MSNTPTNLDAVSSSCLELKEALHGVTDLNQRRSIIKNHVVKLMSVDCVIPDFQSGLEWFNCAEPLSLRQQLRKKIVILDFFTYCCINCMHVLPHLKAIEERFPVEDGLVVVGVHSAKFENEKDSTNIAAAIQRYNITHPVVNDPDGVLWTQLKLYCWPTLVILGPGGLPLFELVGEGHEDDLFEYIETTIEFFKVGGELSTHPLLLASTFGKSVQKSLLTFPGKVACIEEQDANELIAISNTGAHTIVIVSEDGTIKHIIGQNEQSGFTDGDFDHACFNSPQGLAFLSSSILYVADTGNHAIRKIDLLNRYVCTVAGNGSQGSDVCGGEIGSKQSISSPWDLFILKRPCSRPPPFLCICPPAPPGYKGPQEKLQSDNVLLSLDPPPSSSHHNTPCPPFPPPPPLSWPPPPSPLLWPPPTPLCPVPPPPLPQENKDCLEEIPAEDIGVHEEGITEDIILIAMAGSHQIWGLFLQDTVWWKGKLYRKGTCVALAGNGQEENRNNAYPHSAAFAQPSGLTYCDFKKEVYIADSESSSVRCLNIDTGRVSAVVGANKSPNDLFSFGDVDGRGYDVRLQHPLGVAWDRKNRCLYVADSYNHKIKKILLDGKMCSSLIGTGFCGDSTDGLKSQLNEPGGLCVSMKHMKMYIADTNNHCIKVVDLSDHIVKKLHLKAVLEHPRSRDIDTPNSSLTIKYGGMITLCLMASLPPGVKPTVGAPQRWVLKLPNCNWKCDALKGNFDPEHAVTIKIQAPLSSEELSSMISLSVKLFVCADGACRATSSSMNIHVSFSENAPSTLIHNCSLPVQ